MSLFACNMQANKPSGKYIGFEEIEHMSDKNAKWYHKSVLTIENDSVYLDQTPISVRNTDTTRSPADGGYFTYKGKIDEINYEFKAIMKLVDCGYCIRIIEVDSITGDTTYALPDKKAVVKIKNNIVLVNNMLYKPIN